MVLRVVSKQQSVRCSFFSELELVCANFNIEGIFLIIGHIHLLILFNVVIKRLIVLALWVHEWRERREQGISEFSIVFMIDLLMALLRVRIVVAGQPILELVVVAVVDVHFDFLDFERAGSDTLHACLLI